MKFFSGAKNLRNRLKNPELNKIFSQLTEEFHALLEPLVDAPEAAGWIHDFFCDRCLIPLVWKNDEIFCPRCGEDYSSASKKVAASIMDKRYRVSEALVFAAFMVNSGYESWMNLLKNAFDFYTENLKEFNAKSRFSYESPKLTSQLLNDAALLMNYIISVSNVNLRNIDRMKKEFFDPIADALKSKKNIEVHNHDIWILSAIALKEVFFKEKSAYKTLKNLVEIVKRGFSKNGFWYEGSIHYHFYTLEALLKFYKAYRSIIGRNIGVLDEELVKALKVPINFVFPDGRFPNPGEGWPKIGLNTYANIYEYGAELFEDLKPILCHLKKLELRGEDQLVYGKKVSKGLYPERFYFSNECLEISSSLGFPEKSFGLGESIFLRKNPWNIFLKTGQPSTSHLHEDLCNFEVYYEKEPITVDLSNTGYGLPERKSWFSKGLSHNTFFINGKALKFIGPMCVFRNENSIGCLMRESIFGFSFERKIKIGKDLEVWSYLKKEGCRCGMSFIFREFNEEKMESTLKPNVEGAELVDWMKNASKEIVLNVEPVKVVLKSNGEIYLGKGFWIPRDNYVTVIYIEAKDKLELKLKMSEVN